MKKWMLRRQLLAQWVSFSPVDIQSCVLGKIKVVYLQGFTNLLVLFTMSNMFHYGTRMVRIDGSFIYWKPFVCNRVISVTL